MLKQCFRIGRFPLASLQCHGASDNRLSLSTGQDPLRTKSCLVIVSWKPLLVIVASNEKLSKSLACGMASVNVSQLPRNRGGHAVVRHLQVSHDVTVAHRLQLLLGAKVAFASGWPQLLQGSLDMDRSHHNAGAATWTVYEQNTQERLREASINSENHVHMLSCPGVSKRDIRIVIGNIWGYPHRVSNGYPGTSGRGIRGVSGGIREYPHKTVQRHPPIEINCRITKQTRKPCEM